jgi:hypothetical protein
MFSELADISAANIDAPPTSRASSRAAAAPRLAIRSISSGTAVVANLAGFEVSRAMLGSGSSTCASPPIRATRS